MTIPPSPVARVGRLFPTLKSCAVDAVAWVALMIEPCAGCDDWRAAHGTHVEHPPPEHVTGPPQPGMVEWTNGPCTHAECRCRVFVEPDPAS